MFIVSFMNFLTGITTDDVVLMWLHQF